MGILRSYLAPSPRLAVYSKYCFNPVCSFQHILKTMALFYKQRLNPMSIIFQFNLNFLESGFLNH